MCPRCQEGVALVTRDQNQSLDLIERGLHKIGYQADLVRRDYAFADFFASDPQPRRVSLAAFAREPLSYDSACVGAVCSNGQAGRALVGSAKALGAPLFFEIHANGDLTRWKAAGEGKPTELEHIPATHVRQAFWRHRGDWAPDTVFRAKSIPFQPVPVQLDFIDLGLLPAIGEAVSSKLDQLLERVLSEATRTYQEQHGCRPDYARLFALVFRFIAAKVLADRGHPGDWLLPDAGSVLSRVESFYFATAPGIPALADREVQDVIWERIRSAFHFENVSVDALAHIYENTLISSQTRASLGTHSTPPEIAEYLVRRLRLDQIPEKDRRVFEPCAGHGVFLVAAMRRMRELLRPGGMTSVERHAYFVERLSGVELDPFACEVARLSLMLADYPSPDGWRIVQDDVFRDGVLEREARRATIVLCNPPFQRFAPDERARYAGAVEHPWKPGEILRRIMAARPPLALGMVLPRTFTLGSAYLSLHEMLGRAYSRIELVALPERMFRHSEAETVLVVADGALRGGGSTTVRSSIVSRAQLDGFRSTGSVTASRERDWQPRCGSLWSSPLQDVWDRLAHLPALGEAADVHRGIEYNIPAKGQNLGKLVRRSEAQGFARGLLSASDHLGEAFIIRDPVWLNMAEELMQYSAYRLPWKQPKAIVNAARASRTPWRLVAAPDSAGLVCYQSFHGVWPTGGWPIEALAAVLNGPVGNAFVHDHEAGRHNRVRTLCHIPLPALGDADLAHLAGLVRDYCATRSRALGGVLDGNALERLRDCLRQIDALLLRGYDLPPRIERRLLDCFLGYPRPVPFSFHGFLPAELTPAIPYHEYVSPDFRRASARRTLQRLNPIRDAAVHDAMAHLRVLDEDEH